MTNPTLAALAAWLILATAASTLLPVSPAWIISTIFVATILFAWSTYTPQYLMTLSVMAIITVTLIFPWPAVTSEYTVAQLLLRVTIALIGTVLLNVMIARHTLKQS